ncbi:MAG: hypothetical protein WC975_07315 [Phycisphaerae bacterium]
MNAESILTCVCCGLLVGLAGWLFRHSVDRSTHLDGRLMVSEEIFLTKLSALEDRLKGEITAVKVKLEDLEQFTHHIDGRLERMARE